MKGNLISSSKFMSIDEENYEDEDYESVEGLDVFNMDNIQRVLQYKRKYTTLSKNELIDLIVEAKEKKWTALDLSNCGLRDLPPEIGILTDLEILDLSSDYDNNENVENAENRENVFTSFPAEIGQLSKITHLSCYGTEMKKLPKEFSNLKTLKYINLNGCDFEVFPEELCELTGLLELASDRSFTYLPETLGKLCELEELYLPKAELTTLPNSIGNLENLKILYLGGSEILKLPNTIRNLKNLQRLDLEESEIAKVIPPEILEQSPSEVIDYIIRYQNDKNKVVLNESKMIIVGQGGVGKTCLCNMIINDKYVNVISTEGIDIANWHFNYDGEEYKLNTWDFGGQEIYHSTHQFFLTKRSLYIFVWDVRQEEEYGRIDYWLNTIQSFANDSPIIIVVNKCDRLRKNIRQIDVNNLRTRFPQIVAYYNVSCQDNLNINRLREEIMSQAKKLPLMKTIWFSSWINVRHELEELSKVKNIINYIEYVDICSKNAIGSRDEALSLIKYLHDLGVVLHFHGDMLLKNIVILSPEWGTDAVYKILDAQNNILKHRNGILYSRDLPNIWNDTERYPESTYPYILKLMENFQLSFVIEEDSIFLVTELLENNKKTMSLEFPRSSTLNFRYEYSFLPAGIMTRFIVMVHTYLIDNMGMKMCWRKGAYLQYKDAYALILLHDAITERYVDINVSGPNSRNCRELLAIIRSNLEQIHSKIPKIDLKEKVLCNCNPDCHYLHDYKYLNRLEAAGINEERCVGSLKMVDIAMLLDGIKIKRERKKKMTEININPIFNNNPVVNTNANASNVNTNNIDIDIKNSINELQGFLNEFREELTDQNTEVTQDLDKIELSIQKLDSAETKDEIIKSGALNKVRRFLQEFGDSETSTGKVIKGVKHGYSILQDIAEKYNCIAEWCGMPVVPKVFLKDE